MIAVEFRFEGDPSEARDVADAMRDGLRAAQAQGRYAGVALVGGPTLSTSGSKPPPPDPALVRVIEVP